MGMGEGVAIRPLVFASYSFKDRSSVRATSHAGQRHKQLTSKLVFIGFVLQTERGLITRIMVQRREGVGCIAVSKVQI